MNIIKASDLTEDYECDACGKHAELSHDEKSGLALCDSCDAGRGCGSGEQRATIATSARELLQIVTNSNQPDYDARVFIAECSNEFSEEDVDAILDMASQYRNCSECSWPLIEPDQSRSIHALGSVFCDADCADRFVDKETARELASTY